MKIPSSGLNIHILRTLLHLTMQSYHRQCPQVTTELVHHVRLEWPGQKSRNNSRWRLCRKSNLLSNSGCLRVSSPSPPPLKRTVFSQHKQPTQNASTYATRAFWRAPVSYRTWATRKYFKEETHPTA